MGTLLQNCLYASLSVQTGTIWKLPVSHQENTVCSKQPEVIKLQECLLQKFSTWSVKVLSESLGLQLSSSSSSSPHRNSTRGGVREKAEAVSVYNDDKFSDSGFVGYVTPMCNRRSMGSDWENISGSKGGRNYLKTSKSTKNTQDKIFLLGCLSHCHLETIVAYFL